MYESFFIGLGAGIAAAPHCVGMCGGFPLHLSKPSGTGSVALRQLLFVAGKSFTYIFLGSLAAALGIVLFRDTAMARSATALRLLAGSVTVLFGLIMLGLRPPPIRALQRVADAGLIRALLGGLLVSPTPATAFVLGLGIGFVPCPLPMAMLAVAAAAHQVPQGMVLMAGVGLGTAPALLGVGLFGAGVSIRFARVGMRLAGVVLLAIGLLTIGRVTGVIHPKPAAGHSTPSCCPAHVNEP